MRPAQLRRQSNDEASLDEAVNDGFVVSWRRISECSYSVVLVTNIALEIQLPADYPFHRPRFVVAGIDVLAPYDWSPAVTLGNCLKHLPYNTPSLLIIADERDTTTAVQPTLNKC